jgi:hypothetical protein
MDSHRVKLTKCDILIQKSDENERFFFLFRESENKGRGRWF